MLQYGNAVHVVDPRHVPQTVLRHYYYLGTWLCEFGNSQNFMNR